jgi:ATP phosphoribosyltransferase
MLRIGLPKGTIKEKSLDVIRGLTGGHAGGKRLSYGTADTEIFLLKHRDIPGLLARKVIDVGITSTEWLDECGADLAVLKSLDWCDTRMSVIAKEGTRLSDLKRIRCVTEFPSTAASYFRQQQIPSVDIVTVFGSSESLVPSVFDVSIDCVETGRTLRENGLSEISVISHCRTVLVCRHADAQVMHASLVSKIN